MPSKLKKFFKFMDETLKRLTELLGAQDGALHLVPGNKVAAFERSVILGYMAGESSVSLSETSPQRCAVLSWKNRKEETIPPCVLADAAMRVVSQHLSQINADSLVQNSEEWFPYEFGDGFHTSDSLAWKLYDDISKVVEGQYEYITKIDFGLVNSFLGMTYESGVLEAQLVFFTSDTLGSVEQKMTASFGQELSFRYEKLRQIRKLLAGAGKDMLAFVFDSSKKEYVCKGYLPSTKDVPVRIDFKRDGWMLHYNGRALFKATAVHRLKVVEPLFQMVYVSLEKEFGLGTRHAFEVCNDVPSILSAFSKQTHGSGLIFLDLKQDDSKNWVDTLVACSRAFPVDGLSAEVKNDNYEKRLTALARMDGAYVVDVNTRSITHLSVILDGLAIVQGFPEAGARKNSLFMWTANLMAFFLRKPDKCKQLDNRPKVVAVTFSEDGTINTFTGQDALDCFHLKKNGKFDLKRIQNPLLKEIIPM